MQFIVLALASLAAAGPVLENRQAPPSYGGYPEDRPAPPAYDPVTIATRSIVPHYPSATFATRTSAAPYPPSYDDEEPPVATRPTGETCPTVPASTVYVTRYADNRPTGCTTITTITVTSVIPQPQPTGGDDNDDNDDDDNTPPTGEDDLPPAVRPIRPCSGLFTPRCCQVDILGLASLTCNSVPDPITSLDNFDAQCAASGTTAQCCLLPVLGQGLICNDP